MRKSMVVVGVAIALCLYVGLSRRLAPSPGEAASRRAELDATERARLRGPIRRAVRDFEVAAAASPKTAKAEEAAAPVPKPTTDDMRKALEAKLDEEGATRPTDDLAGRIAADVRSAKIAGAELGEIRCSRSLCRVTVKHVGTVAPDAIPMKLGDKPTFAQEAFYYRDPAGSFTAVFIPNDAASLFASVHVGDAPGNAN